jgi:translation initiation factor 3 subunit G
LPKFGMSKKDPPGPNSYTTVVADDVQMQFLSSDKAGAEVQPDANNPFADAIKEGKGIVRCRYCQDAHFSAKCPYKDVGLPPMDIASRIADDAIMDGKKVCSERQGRNIRMCALLNFY